MRVRDAPLLLIWARGICRGNTKTGMVERTRFEGKMILLHEIK